MEENNKEIVLPKEYVDLELDPFFEMHLALENAEAQRKKTLVNIDSTFLDKVLYLTQHLPVDENAEDQLAYRKLIYSTWKRLFTLSAKQVAAINNLYNVQVRKEKASSMTNNIKS